MNFIIDDQPFSSSKEPAACRQMRAVLAKVQAGRLLTLERLAELAGISPSRAGILVFQNDFNANRVRHKKRFLYGNPQTVKLWLKANSASRKS